MHIKITDKLGAAINNGMFGLFFEDINYGLDGGLYAEMIENRSYEFFYTWGIPGNCTNSFDGLYAWKVYPEGTKAASLNINTIKPLNDINPHYLEFIATDSHTGFTNKAYDGICMKKELEYNISIYARAENYDGNIEVLIENNGNIAAGAVIAESVGNEWTKYQTVLVCNEDVLYGKFIIRLTCPGTVCFDFISMIPSDAVLGLFRKDLVAFLKDMKPGFLRFPGGCVVEGNILENRYQWKKSIGKAEERKTNWNRWAIHENNEDNMVSKYSHYNQTLGIGYYEYFLLCEYLGAKPLPIISVGIACQYQSSEFVATDSSDFQEYIDDAIDLIEFANGPVDSNWGGLRAQMGHPEPFDLDMLGIGNEQWETEQIDFYKRYEIFEREIHDKYPGFRLIGTAGPDVISEKYDSAWKYYHEVDKSGFVYAVDEHYYLEPDWFIKNIHFYDGYPRDIKVFAGEYAAHIGFGMNSPQFNSWGAAISEAAFLTGIERNADIVVMASYAPLFARLGYTQWSTDMIWFDAINSYASPSYYVQKMYSTQMGTHLLQTLHNEDEIPYSVTYDTKEHVIIIKLVNTLNQAVNVSLAFDPVIEIEGDGEDYYLQGCEDDINSMISPDKISIKKKTIDNSDLSNIEIPSKSFHVIKVKCKANFVTS